MASLTFTPLRISTLVTTGHLGSTINLAKLFEQFPSIMIPIGYPAEGFLKMEHETKVVGHSARDMLTKRRVSAPNSEATPKVPTPHSSNPWQHPRGRVIVWGCHVATTSQSNCNMDRVTSE